MVGPMKRANLATCTDTMLAVLQKLRDGYQSDAPFLYLDDADSRTIRALTRRDWIIASIPPEDKKLDNPRYAITGRGVKACEVYEVPSEEYDVRRWDGLCPRCGERECGEYSTGLRRPYCRECENKIKTRTRKLFGSRKKEGLCPTCGIRMKHVTPSGKVKSYCLECRREREKSYRKQKSIREFEQVTSGEVLLCYRCHKRPRYLTGHTVQDYCWECYSQYRQERRRI